MLDRVKPVVHATTILVQDIFTSSWSYVSLDQNSEMNITGTLPQGGNVKLFGPSLSTQGSTRPKQNILMLF